MTKSDKLVKKVTNLWKKSQKSETSQTKWQTNEKTVIKSDKLMKKNYKLVKKKSQTREKKI